MRVLVAIALVAGLGGCQAQPPSKEVTSAPQGERETKLPFPISQDIATPKAPTGGKAVGGPPEPQQLGSKTSAGSFELPDGSSIVSATVVRMKHFCVVKGRLKAEQPPKAIKFVLAGETYNGYSPGVTLSVYDPAIKTWRKLGDVTVKGDVTKRYEISGIPAGVISFLVHYNATDPKGASVRPSVYVKSVELEF